MTRLEKHAQAKALRDSGMTVKAVALRLGVKPKSIYDLLGDPDGSKGKARRAKYEHPCLDCGIAINSGSPDVGERCTPCHNARMHNLSRRWMIDSIIEWDDLFGAPPAATDWNQSQARSLEMWDRVERYNNSGREWPAANSVQYIFGSWNAGIEAAGFEPRKAGHYGRDGEEPSIRREAVGMYRAGLSCAKVGERMGVGPHAVRYWLMIENEPRRTVAEATRLRFAA